jgi:NADH-quinone oxidoreductase subunit J
MNIESILFYGFALLCIATSIMVISAKNPIHSVFYLVLVFLNGAGLFILLGVEFLAIIFIIVYVGAIAILFLFIVMMLNIKLVELNENMLRYLPIGTLIAIIFFFEIFLLIEDDLISLHPIYPIFPISEYLFMQEVGENLFTMSWNNLLMISWAALIIGKSNLEFLGYTLYTYYFHLFWIAGLILLVAMIGAIVLTLYSQSNVKSQEVFKQSSSHFSKSIILKK